MRRKIRRCLNSHCGKHRPDHGMREIGNPRCDKCGAPMVLEFAELGEDDLEDSDWRWSSDDSDDRR
jgi:hypothetical protein